ncbi:MAG: hypothetical protein NC131_14255 [Roseburia sp.]|nr:hypothetical protein [Roseburia sp.]
MVYGNFAKSLSKNNENITMISESKSIINFLENEYNNYNSLLLNESFSSDTEKLVIESKMKVLQESITGALIVAIIAIIGALIALITKFISMMQNGKDTISDNMDKMGRSMNQNSSRNKDKEISEAIQYAKNYIEGRSNSNIIYEYMMNIFNAVEYDITNSGINNDEFKGFCDYNFCKFAPVNDIKLIENNIIKASESNGNFKLVWSDSVKDISKFVSSDGKLSYLNLITKYNEMVREKTSTIVRSVNPFLKSGIFEESKKIQEKMTKDLNSLKKTYEKYRKNNFNADDITNDEKRTKFINEMLNVNQDTLNEINRYIQTWAKLEQHRIKYCNIVIASYNANYERCIKEFYNKN